MNKILAIAIALFFTVTGFAQVNQYISYKYVYADYLGPIDGKYFNFSDNQLRGVQLGYHRDINSAIRLNVPFRLGKIKYPISDTDASQFDAQMFYGLDVTGAYKFNNGTILAEDAKLAPYVLAGIGAAYLQDEKAAKFNVPLGVGLNWQLTRGFALQAQTEYRISEFNHMHHSAGFVFQVSGRKDDVAVATPIKDSDGDGISDEMDECPNTVGTAAFNGCPDTDGDGIKDSEDNCPNIAGVSSNRGCPIVTKDVMEVLSFAKTGVQFETASARLKPASFPILDQVVAILKKHPEYNLSIGGHTDSQGKEEDNLKLSTERANACLTYIVSQGISTSRIKSSGFGESMPIATNDTKEGMAKNRRVEFEVYFNDK